MKTTKRATPAGVVTIAAVGDIVMGSTPNLPPDGGRSFFDDVETDLAGDVVLGNLEGTLSVGGGSKCGAGSTNCYAFQTPPSYAAWLRKAGFTVMNLANNHAFDYGPSGQAQTLAALAEAGSRRPRAGRVRSPTSRSATIKVAIVGFAPYRWAQSLTNIPAARRLVRKAAANADVVIVTMHAGAEGTDHTHVIRGTEMFLGENRGNSIAFTHAVVDAGADLVIGSGPHVLRGMEWYRGHLIAYSLGNFAGYKVFALGGPLSTQRHPPGDASRRWRVRQRHARADEARRCRPARARPGRERPRDRAHALAGGLRRARRQGLVERPADALETRRTDALGR